MKLTGHDLKQINDTTLDLLPSDQLLSFSKLMLADLKEVMDRLNQNSNNSSRPPSTTLPWDSNSKDQENAGGNDEDDESHVVKNPPSEDDDFISPEDEPLGGVPEKQDDSPPQKSDDTSATTETMSPPVNLKPGKQPGAEGYSRTQQLDVTEIIHHALTHCTLCNAELGGYEAQVAWTAFYTIDIAEYVSGNAGIILTNTKHIFFETKCDCGHHNREEPYAAMPDVTWPKTNLSEWRLVGSRLAAMIVLLSKRHRNSRRLIREFLLTFLHLELSVGTIDQTIREAGRSAAPLEEELVRDIEAAALIYVDETSWKEAGVLRWLWVFRTLTVVFFMVGKRDRTIFCNLLLNGKFKGIVMSDGWIVYREYANRLRCWAHLIRKARGLSESYNYIAAKVGLEILALFTTFQNAIYAARNQHDQALGVLTKQYEKELERLKALCEAYKDSKHEKLSAFARELLNDWDIIVRQIHDPSLPLTNNEAERILRHWVIDRRLSNGTRTAEGTRSFTVLASVIETCRIRGAPVWDYLTQVIAAARKGLQLPALPIIPA
jgi:transposase